MKRLLSSYGFKQDHEYYQMIAESFINGQYTQAQGQYGRMPKENRKRMLKMVLFEGCALGLSKRHQEILFDLM